MGREIQAGRVWTNCYHAYPDMLHSVDTNQSGIGRETHKMMLNHYRQVKNLHVSYSEKKLGSLRIILYIMAREESRAIFFMKVKATDSALKLIEQLKAQHGEELLFHQSGGCCDGSAPMYIQEMNIWLSLAMSN